MSKFLLKLYGNKKKGFLFFKSTIPNGTTRVPGRPPEIFWDLESPEMPFPAFWCVILQNSEDHKS